MVQKHIEDDGDLSLVINGDGDLLLVCSKGHKWIGKFQPVAEGTEDARQALVNAMRDAPRSFAIERLNLDDFMER